MTSWTCRRLSSATDWPTRSSSGRFCAGFIGQGDRVALILRNGVAFCEPFYAIARIGAICCPINYRLSAGEIAIVLNDSEHRRLIYDPAFEGTLEELRQAGDIDGVPALPLASAPAVGDSYERRLASAAKEAVDTMVDPGDAHNGPGYNEIVAEVARQPQDIVVRKQETERLFSAQV